MAKPDIGSGKSNLADLQNEFDETAVLMHQNMDNILKRNWDIDEDDKRAENLESFATQFKPIKAPKRVKDAPVRPDEPNNVNYVYCCGRRKRSTCVIIIVALLLLLVAVICVIIVLTKKPWESDLDDGT